MRKQRKQTQITAEAPGFSTAEWVVDAEPASTRSHQVKLEREKKPQATPKPPARGTPTAIYVGLAATGVCAGMATATALVAIKKSKDLKRITDASAADDAKGTGF